MIATSLCLPCLILSVMVTSSRASPSKLSKSSSFWPPSPGKDRWRSLGQWSIVSADPGPGLSHWGPSTSDTVLLTQEWRGSNQEALSELLAAIKTNTEESRAAKKVFRRTVLFSEQQTPPLCLNSFDLHPRDSKTRSMGGYSVAWGHCWGKIL